MKTKILFLVMQIVQTSVKQAPKGEPKSDCLRQHLLISGKFTVDLKYWPLNMHYCLIQMVFETSLTVMKCSSAELLY